jgi:DNA-binding MarR family transcriptional regulator
MPDDDAEGRARDADLEPEVREALRGVLALQLAQRRATAALAGPKGLADSDVLALALLVQHERTTVGALAKRLGLTPGSTSLLVSRLEKAGLIAREAVEGDRRVVRLGVTAAGRAAASEVRDVYADAFEQTAGEGSKEPLRVTGAVLEQTAAHLVDAVEHVEGS